MNWWKNLKGKISLNETLSKHTTFKIGGPAQYFFEPRDIDDLRLLLGLVSKYRIPFRVMGAGSNILVSDSGIKGVVIHLGAPYFMRLSFEDNCIELGAGCLLSRVVALAKKRGLSGVEFLAGIPGTVGGALAMNAGVKEKNIGDLVENVTVIGYNNNIVVFPKSEIKFGYRVSSLSKYTILSARIKIVKRDKREIEKNIKAHLKYRRLTQDWSLPSAGCIFKNPEAESAGRLIDLCGLKGKKIGGAGVSLKHANFIVNLGSAKAEDVLRLMNLIRRKVKGKFNIALKPEIKIWQQ